LVDSFECMMMRRLVNPKLMFSNACSNVRYIACSELQEQLTSLCGELYQNKDFKRAKFP
jgi:hypothetical protein